MSDLIFYKKQILKYMKDTDANVCDRELHHDLIFCFFADLIGLIFPVERTNRGVTEKIDFSMAVHYIGRANLNKMDYFGYTFWKRKYPPYFDCEITTFIIYHRNKTPKFFYIVLRDFSKFLYRSFEINIFNKNIKTEVLNFLKNNKFIFGRYP